MVEEETKVLAGDDLGQVKVVALKASDLKGRPADGTSGSADGGASRANPPEEGEVLATKGGGFAVAGTGTAAASAAAPKSFAGQVTRWPCEVSNRANAVVSLCAFPEAVAWAGAPDSSYYVVGRRKGQLDLVDVATGLSKGMCRAHCDPAARAAESDSDDITDYLFDNPSDSEDSDSGDDGAGGARGHLVGVRRLPDGLQVDSSAPTLATCTSRGVVELWQPGRDWFAGDHLGDAFVPELLVGPVARWTAGGAGGKRGRGGHGKHEGLGGVEAFEVAGRGGACWLATGGRENNLKLWDVEAQALAWAAKSPKQNELGIWDKPWLSELLFLDPAGCPSVVLCGTANHQLRLYDARAKRRPIFELEWGESRITCLCPAGPLSAGHGAEGEGEGEGEGGGYSGSVWCGNAIGQICSLDLKMRQMSGSLKGTLGSVRSLARHPDPEKPLLFACGLDRFLRVYDVKKRQQVCAVYLKQYLNAADVMQDMTLPPEPEHGSGSEEEEEEKKEKKGRKRSAKEKGGVPKGKSKKKKRRDH